MSDQVRIVEVGPCDGPQERNPFRDPTSALTRSSNERDAGKRAAILMVSYDASVDCW